MTIMKKQQVPLQKPVKPDLKHDNMEYSAATDGDDKLDLDIESALEIESEEITAEELALLEEDDFDKQEAALMSAERDSQADVDNFLTVNEAEERADGEDDPDN